MADSKKTIKEGDKLYAPGMGIVKVIKSGNDTDCVISINGNLEDLNKVPKEDRCMLCKNNPRTLYSHLCDYCKHAVRQRWKRRFFGIK